MTTNLQYGVENRITVKVDNSPSEEALPKGSSFDWADDGGLIRPVKLVVTGQTALFKLKSAQRSNLDKLTIRLQESCMQKYCYAVKEYHLSVSSTDEEFVKRVIPDMYPGDILKMKITIEQINPSKVPGDR